MALFGGCDSCDGGVEQPSSFAKGIKVAFVFCFLFYLMLNITFVLNST